MTFDQMTFGQMMQCHILNFIAIGSFYKYTSIRIVPGPNVIKLFTAAIYNKLDFFPGRPFQPSLMFVGKARSYPGEVFFR
jgi:hypothetical protein